MIVMMQLMIRFGFLIPQLDRQGLSNVAFALLLLATLCIAAGGYVINDIFDQNTDAINKPNKRYVGVSITETQAYNFYAGLTLCGVGIGFYLANSIGHPKFATFFVLIAASLYFYASTLKPLLLIGNLVVALVLASSIVVVGVFDLFPLTVSGNQEQMRRIFSILLDYTLLAFLLHFVREIIKDIEDYEGDWAQGMQTLPIVLGVTKTAKCVAVFTLVPIGLLLYYIITYFLMNNLHLISIYCLIFVLTPLCFLAIKMWSATSKEDFKSMSLLSKWIVFFGIFILPILDYTVKHHA